MKKELGADGEAVDHKKTKKLHNPLRIYSRDPDYIDKCPRAWSPEIYEFSEKEIDYENNAFDRFIPSMELRSPDTHSNFTRYLQGIPIDHRYFYRWIVNSRDFSKIGTEDLDFKWEDIDTIQERLNRIGIQEPKVVHMRRAYSESQFKLTKWRKIDRNEDIATTIFPFVSYNEVIHAERYLKRKYISIYGYKHQFGLKTKRYESVEVVNVYGPKRFYVRKINQEGSTAQVPGKFFSFHFEKYIESNQRTLLHLGMGGPAIYFDPSATYKYQPIYVFYYNTRRTVMMYLETGEIKSLYNPDRNRMLRLPDYMERMIRPQAIPCRLRMTDITSLQWADFVKQLKERKLIYAIYALHKEYSELVIARAKSLGPRSLDRLFCSDLLCTGACLKDPMSLEISEENRKSKSQRKSSISSDNLTSIGCVG